MKRIREADLQKEKQSVICCKCEKAPTHQLESFWVQIGFNYQCTTCARKNGLSL